MYVLILQDLLKVPTIMPCHTVDMLSVEELVILAMVVQPPTEADTPAEETHHGSHSSREEGVEGGGASPLCHHPATPMWQFWGVKEEEGLVPQQ